MTTSRADQQGVSGPQLTRRNFIRQLQHNSPLQQAQPLLRALLDPTRWWLTGPAAVNALQSKVRCAEKHVHLLQLRSMPRVGEQGRSWPADRWRVPPAAADLKTVALSQRHNIVVVSAVDQGLPQGRIQLTEGNEGVELADFLNETVQICRGHGQRLKG
jgi:hypothetical protein